MAELTLGECPTRLWPPAGHATAANLRGVGIDVDLAPVLDVAPPGGTIAAAHRGFGSTPVRVAAAGVAFVEGLQGGVAALAKHFPGLGAARENTDFAVERIGPPRRRCGGSTRLRSAASSRWEGRW